MKDKTVDGGGVVRHDKGKITHRDSSAESENIDKMLWQFIFP